MAKAKSAPVEAVTVTYDLFELPTAQHKAGLAGLLLQIEHMAERDPSPPVPRVVERTATTATIEFTSETTQSLFDDIYEAAAVEVKVKSKWPNATEKRPPEEVIEAVDGKPRKVKYFFYEVVLPTGSFLRQHLSGDREPWHKLWRDMLWAIPRGNPQSRQPFEQRAAVPKQPCKEGMTTWADLLKVAKARAKNEFYTDAVAGSLWLGAQAMNAEAVAFEGRAEQTLLLHFWPLATQVFVPAVLKIEREGGHLIAKTEFVGYVLAIPEVSNLDWFLRRYPQMLANLKPEAPRFRPAAAIIDLPAEGALSFLAQLGTDKATVAEHRRAFSSVEYLHQVKLGNNIKTQGAGRVADRPHLIAEYERIVGQDGGRPRYGNPLFRRGLMMALLDDRLTKSQWYRPFGKLFAEWEAEVFVNSDAPPKNMPWFWVDARKKLQEVIQNMPPVPEPDSKKLSDEKLVLLIDRIVKRFLLAKAKKKRNVDPKTKLTTLSVEMRKDIYKEKQRVALDAFYKARSRHGQEFVSFFTEEICSFGSYFEHKSDEIRPFSTALIDPEMTDDLKTLTLLTLSANF